MAEGEVLRVANLHFLIHNIFIAGKVLLFSFPFAQTLVIGSQLKFTRAAD